MRAYAPLGVWVAVALAWAVGCALFWWPLPLQLGTHVWGDRFDAWTTLWLMGHLHAAIRDGTLSGVTTDILFPRGYSLWSFGHAGLQLVGVGLMLMGVPLVWAYNLCLIGGHWLSALAAHLFGRELGGSHAAGAAAGIVFATSPYLYGEGAAGCIELVLAGWLPLFGWAAVRLLRQPGWGRFAAAAGILAIIGPFNWYYTLFAGMLGVGLLLWQAVIGRWREAAWLAGACALAGMLDAPLIPLVRGETPTRPPMAPGLFTEPEVWDLSQAIGDASLPIEALDEPRLLAHDALQTVRNSTFVEALLPARFTVNPLQSTPGAIAFTLGLAGALAAGRRSAGWALIAAGATILTLGPFLQLDNSPPLREGAAAAPLPYYYLYQYVPFFAKAYRPYRISVVTLTALAACAAAGVAALQADRPRRWGWAVGLVGLGGVAFAQPLWRADGAAPAASRPTLSAVPPRGYDWLAAQPRGGVIEVPLHYQPVTVGNALLQYYQLAHRQPLLNCNQLIRRPDLMAFREIVTGNTFLRRLVDLARTPPPYTFQGEDLPALSAMGFKYVVWHRRVPTDQVRLAGDVQAADRLGASAIAWLRASLTPLYHDEELEVLGIPAEASPGERVWTGAESLPLDLPLARYDLPLTLAPGGAYPLAGALPRIRSLQVWARWVGDAPGALGVRQGEQTTPLDLAPGVWQWVEVPLPGEGPVSLVNLGGETVQVELTQGEGRL